MRRLAAASGLLALGLCLTACAGDAGPPATAPAAPPALADTGLDRMERLALAADRCWFDSGDPAFAPYSLAPELASFSGRPRFLLVPRGQPEARPLLVVEGRAGSGDVSYFGPLLGAPVGQRIAADLDRWRSGGSACAA